MWRNSQRALKKCANCYCIVLYFVGLYFVDPVRLASVSHGGYFGCYLLARQFCCKSRDGRCWQELWDWSCEQAKEHTRRVCSSRGRIRVKMDFLRLCFSSMIPLYLRLLSCSSMLDKYENMWGRRLTKWKRSSRKSQMRRAKTLGAPQEFPHRVFL